MGGAVSYNLLQQVLLCATLNGDSFKREYYLINVITDLLVFDSRL